MIDPPDWMRGHDYSGHRHRVKRKRLHDRLAGWIDETGDTFDLPEL